jgi:hypothetical protein
MIDASGWLRFFTLGWGATFSAYVALQCLALLTLKRQWWIGALIPLPFMIWLLVVTLQAYQAQSNIWPIFMILISPFVALLLAVLEIAGLRVQKHPHGTSLTAATVAIIGAAGLVYIAMFSNAA